MIEVTIRISPPDLITEANLIRKASEDMAIADVIRHTSKDYSYCYLLMERKNANT